VAVEIWDARLTHEVPYRTSRRVRRMARTACITVAILAACLAAGIAAGVATATDEPGATNHGPSKLQQPGVGAVLVGFSVGMLVFAAMRIAYVLHERRREPLDVRPPVAELPHAELELRAERDLAHQPVVGVHGHPELQLAQQPERVPLDRRGRRSARWTTGASPAGGGGP
jgi:hypothetical protein